MLFGARISLFVGVVSVIMGLAMGGTIGAIAGAFGGRIDAVLMRIVDVLLAIPGILLAIGIVVWLDRGLPQIMFAVAADECPDLRPDPARQHARAPGDRTTSSAARSIGRVDARGSCSGTCCRTRSRRSSSPATLALATAIIDVAGLGFLGLGPADPRIAEWGTMLTGRDELLSPGAVDHLLHRASRSR